MVFEQTDRTVPIPQALIYANEGDPVGKWFEAALPGREAFCMRDVSHQAYGALMLGLEEHLFNMMHKFCINISEFSP